MNIAEKKSELKVSNIMAVKEIIQKHHTKNVRKIQSLLVGEYGISISDRTVRNYKTEIAQKKKSEKTVKKVIEKPAPISPLIGAEKETVYPFELRDPANKPHIVPHDHYGISIPWSGDTLNWSTKSPIWCWSDGRPYMKDGTVTKPPMRIPKSAEERWASNENDL